MTNGNGQLNEQEKTIMTDTNALPIKRLEWRTFSE